MWTEVAAVAVPVIVIGLIYWAGYKTKFQEHVKDFPPGPASLLYHWNTYFPISVSTHLRAIQKWKERYGEVLGIQFGDSKVIIIHGYKLIKEAFSDSKFNGRVQLNDDACSTQNKGLTKSIGKCWSEQRKFTTKNLRDLGVGKQSLESMIHEEITELINSTLKLNIDQPINLLEHLNLSVLNSLWHLIAGERFSLDDPELKAFLCNVIQISHNMNDQLYGNLTFAKPYELPRWFSPLISKNTSEKAIEEASRFIQSRIKTHKDTYDDDSVRDVMDLYIREIQDSIDKDSSFYKEIGQTNMVETILNILTGGIEPTSYTLNWVLYFLSKNPSVQKKVQDEVDVIIGHFHQSSVNDRLKMPYTESVISETLRIASAISTPFGIPHFTTENVSFHNFNIPKGTMVVGNLHDLHFNNNTWKDPHIFKPDRFLQGNDPSKDFSYPQSISIAPFSLGKRNCPGETFARDILFLFVTSLCQRFHILPSSRGRFEVNDSNFKLSDLNPKTASNFKIVFEDRLEFLNRALELEQEEE